MIIIKNLLPITALCAIVVDGSAEYVHQPICSSQEGMEASSEESATMISEPHKYFPRQIKHIVDVADAISPDAIGLPYDQSYPVIDISPWINPSISSDKEKEDVVKQVLEEATTSGSFNIIGHGIDDALFDRLYTAARSFFSMSLEQKMG